MNSPVTTDWTEDDIGDQSGRTFLVTGANSGIGFEAARALAQHGAHVVLACRSHTKAAEAIRRIDDLGPDGTTEFLELDLGDLESVERAASTFLADHDRLDVLVNNAGLMAIPHKTTAQGFEMQLGVNHLGHFALTGRLLPTLLESGRARVVSISSTGHRPGRIDLDDLNSETSYGPWKAYFQSKLANLLFTRELQHRLGGAGSEVIATAAHPGGSATNLGHENPGGPINTLMHWGRPLFDRLGTQSAAMGALPTLRAATDPGAVGVDYFGPGGFAEQRGYPVLVDSSARAKDGAIAAALWHASEEMTGVEYPI